MHLDDEDPGRGLEADLEDIRSRFVELAGTEKRVLKPRVYVYGLVTGLVSLPGAGRQEAHGHERKGRLS